MPTFERMKIRDKKVNKTSKRANPDGLSSGPIQSVGIKLIVKEDKAAHIPSIKKIGPIAKEVHAIVLEELWRSKQLGIEGRQDKR